MKKILFIIAIILACNATAMAQQARIAFFSYQAVLTALPQYVKVYEELEKTKQQYAAELQSSEQEFSDKYEMFVEQQNTLSPAIKAKRQADLQDLYDRNMKFRHDLEDLLKQQEHDALAPIKAKIQDAINKIGGNGGYLLVVNSDSEACPYIDSANSLDVTQDILKLANEAK